MERTYIIPFRKALVAPRKKRAKKAVNILRDYIWRHMKPIDVIIHPEVNEKIWERGIEKPPNKIRVRASKDREGLVYVYLA
ncbi:MAG: 50S ribosomal protein L31e [Candidatus Lokiarchaeota archaeon]|nr:50S ribosomal protein L31e [Candidatus Lokiarchaeota archaeon]